MSKYRIKKIKWEKQPELTFYKLNPDLPELEPLAEIVFKSSKLDANKIRSALYDLTDEFLKICEFDIDLKDHKLIVYKVDLFQSKKYGMGAQLSGKLGLKESHEPLIIKAPRQWEDVADPKDQLSANLIALLNDLTSECEDYIDQGQNQFELFSVEVSAHAS